ncbi:MAG: lipopeptide [Halothiobacillaceae bacterium]|nr:lipopeptide [Halothiobacillaceae bacterium]
MSRRLATLMLSMLLLAPLAGCGQKGPLYLPDESEQAPAASDDSQPAAQD